MAMSPRRWAPAPGRLAAKTRYRQADARCDFALRNGLGCRIDKLLVSRLPSRDEDPTG